MAAARAEQQGLPNGAQVKTGVDTGKHGEIRIFVVVKEHLGDDRIDSRDHRYVVGKDGAECGKAVVLVTDILEALFAWSCAYELFSRPYRCVPNTSIDYRLVCRCLWE